MSKVNRVNVTYVVTVCIVYMFMLGAAAISFTHIVDVSRTLGLGWEAYTVPFFIDGFAALGKIGRSHRFAESTRRAGLKVMAAAGAVSLAANVAAGDNLGQQLYGVLVVSGFVAAEWYSAKLQAAPEPTRTIDPVRSAAARQAAQTRKVNAAARAKAAKPRNRKPRASRATETAELEHAYAMPNAPVSPAPVVEL